MSEPTHPEVAILNAALELSPDQRAAYLDKACAGDAALRRQVEALLASHEQAGGFLEGSPSSFFQQTARVAFQPAEKPGDRIGRYKLLQQIGEGGCGVVYMAEQEEPVRRRVALKVIKLGMDTKQVIARFEAERQALALMDHPNIARIYDAGVTEGGARHSVRAELDPKDSGAQGTDAPYLCPGRPYFVMELVRGTKITEFCDENNLSTEDRLKLFIQVCQAIQHAHQKGVIHRDIKPSNILVTVNNGVPVPKVIDFGIAKATAGRLTDQTLFTAFEQFIGTPAYMSPEQAVLTSLDIDTRSDIYSLGVLLYELLTGGPPFDQKELLAAGLDAMRRTIQEKEPPRPSTRLSTMAAEAQTMTARHRHTEAPKLIHLLRGDLDWIVMRCLEKDRVRRYETANGLAMDIQRHLKNDPVVARPPTAAYRLQKLVRRNKLVVAASAAVFTSLLIGLVVSTWMFIRESESRRQTETAAHKSEQIAQFLTAMLEGVGPAVARGEDTTLLRGILDQTAGHIGEELTGQPDVEAELRTTLGQVYEAIGEYTEAERMHRRALDLRQQHFGPEHPQVARSLNALAMALRHQEGKLEEAERVQRSALAMQQSLLPNDHLDISQSLNDLAIILQETGDLGMLSEAEDMLKECIGMRRRLLAEDDEHTAMAINNLAANNAHQGRWDKAASNQQEALDLQRTLLEPDHPDIAQSLNNLSSFLLNMGDFANAEAAARAALKLRKEILESDHPYIATSYNNLASVLWQEMKLKEAETNQRAAIEIQIAATSRTHPESLKYVDNLGSILRDQGRFAEAEATHREVFKVRTNVFPAVSAPVAQSLNNLARVLSDEGQFAESEELQRQVLEIFAELLPTNSHYIPIVLANLGVVQRARGKYGEAATNQLKALAMRLRIFEPNDLPIAQSRNGLGQLYLEWGKPAEAETNLLQALAICRQLPEDHQLLLASTLEHLVLARLDQDNPTDTVPWAEQCLEIRERRLTNNWSMFSAQALLGRASLAETGNSDAASLLQTGCEGLKERWARIPAPDKPPCRKAVQILIQLYQDTNRPEQADEWQRELTTMP